MINQEGEKKKSKKRIILKLFLLIFNILILFFLYYLLTEFGANPFIIVLVLIFVFLTFTGPLYFGKSKSLYSRMFPNKKKKLRERYQRRREEYKKKEDMRQFQLKHLNKISLDIEYRQPIIRKCENCGMMMTKFVKKCPICGKKTSSYK